MSHAAKGAKTGALLQELYGNLKKLLGARRRRR
jgi:hypothetical protein